MNRLLNLLGEPCGHSGLLAAGLFRDRAGRLEVFSLVEAVAVVVLIATASWWAWTLWKQRNGESADRNPQRLFDALCRAHGLNRNERRLISQLAAFYQLPQPCLLFVEPERFDPNRLSGFGGDLAELKLLNLRLFKHS